jgi:homogentisate 1,2-dioxygenase
MQNRPFAGRVGDSVPESPDLDRYADYEDGAALVICDRTNPRAWLRADTTAALDP